MKAQSLKLNKEFKRAYGRGRFRAHPLLVTYMVKNYTKENRIGITCGKKIGNAVQRNRARRLIKEAYRQLEPQLTTGYDIVFVAREAMTAPSQRLAGQPVKMGEVLFVMKKQIEWILSQPNRSAQKPNAKSTPPPSV